MEPAAVVGQLRFVNDQADIGGTVSYGVQDLVERHFHRDEIRLNNVEGEERGGQAAGASPAAG